MGICVHLYSYFLEALCYSFFIPSPVEREPHNEEVICEKWNVLDLGATEPVYSEKSRGGVRTHFPAEWEDQSSNLKVMGNRTGTNTFH